MIMKLAPEGPVLFRHMCDEAGGGAGVTLGPVLTLAQGASHFWMSTATRNGCGGVGMLCRHWKVGLRNKKPPWSFEPRNGTENSVCPSSVTKLPAKWVHPRLKATKSMSYPHSSLIAFPCFQSISWRVKPLAARK